jgi:hypothetical protein
MNLDGTLSGKYGKGDRKTPVSVEVSVPTSIDGAWLNRVGNRLFNKSINFVLGISEKNDWARYR